MKEINKLSLALIIILIIVIPIIIITLNKNSEKQIAENAAAAQTYAKESSEKQARKDAEYTKISSEIPGIVCIGSDFMASSGTVNTKFTTELQNKLSTEGYKIPITNLAVEGENNLTILGRLGVVPFVIQDTVTIPEKADLIEINLKSSDKSGYVWPLAVNADNTSFNPVTINENIIGMIGGDTLRDPETGENKHYFVRLSDGEPFTIPAGSVINTSSDDEYKDYVHIIWMGENENWSDFNDLKDDIQSIIDYCGANKYRYIVMGLPSGSSQSMAEYDKIMNDAFGSHYLNIRNFLSNYNLSQTKLEYTDADLQQQKQGIVPSVFLQENGSRLNDFAYTVLTDFVYDGLIANDCIRKPAE